MKHKINCLKGWLTERTIKPVKVHSKWYILMNPNVLTK